MKMTMSKILGLAAVLLALLIPMTGQAAPTVTAISPNSGSTAGGTNVTITGTGFTGASATGVAIGGSDGITWNSQTSAVDNNWISVTYGNDLFVAVANTGIGNRVMTSPDGIAWTSSASAADNVWRSVVFGNGLFVAVGDGGPGDRVMTSPDGNTWTSRTPAANNNWRSVTYGNGLFVAVSSTGTGNRVMTSPDGITWTSQNAATDSNWYGVTYGNGLFVAVASGGLVTSQVMSSPDGITWTSQTAAANSSWRSVTYGNGLFVAVSFFGSTDLVMTSPDGITWTSRTAAANSSWMGVTYGNGLYVAVSDGGTVMSSPNGITWTSRTSAASNYWSSVTYGKGRFVAVSSTGTGNRVMSSGPPSATNVTVVSDTSITATAPAGSAGSTGVWVTAPGGMNADNSLYTYLTDSVTYNVTYNDNGSTSGSVPNDATAYSAAATVTALGNTGTLAKTGYTFGGWNTQADGLGTDYTAGSGTFSINANTTLYAKWTINSYTVTFDGNTGTGTMAAQSANYNVATALTTNAFTKTGYTFAGWNTVAGGGGIAYANSASYPFTASTTLYAQWTLIPTFSVTYNGNTNSGGSVPTDANAYANGATVTVLGNSGTLTKTGYTFNGWNTQADGLGTNYTTGSGTFSINANTTLYAKWTGANAAPTASAVAITGTAQVGVQLTGGYTYADAESNAEGTSTFRWVRDTVNTGLGGGTDVATTQSYTAVANDLGKYLYFCVTPVATTGTLTGTEVCSSATAAVKGTLTNVTVSADTYAAGATATYTFQYTTQSPLVAGNAVLAVNFPTGFSKTGADDLAGGACGAVTVNIGGASTACSTSNAWGGGASQYGSIYSRWITIGSSVNAGTVVTVTISGVVNSSTGGSKSFDIKTGTVSGTVYDTPASAPTVTVVANAAPTFVSAGAGSLTVAQAASATDIKGLLHVSDSDSSQTVTWTQSSAPSHGSLSFSSATASSGSTDITPGGTITYTPTASYVGADSFTVQASDGTASATRTINVTVGSARTVTVNALTLNSMTAGTAFTSQSFTGAGGYGAYTYSVSAGSLPPGLSLSAGGALTGTPSTAGAYNFTVQATDSSAGNGPYSGTLAFSGTVAAAPLVPPANPIPTVIPPPPVAGVGSNPLTPLNLSSGDGPAMTTCLRDILRTVMGANAVYQGQTADGGARIGQTGLVASFYALEASTSTNNGLGQGAGIYLRGGNPLNVVTNCGTFTTVPAVYNLTEWGAFLNGMGLSAQFNTQGVMTVVLGGTTYVARPDYLVTQGEPGAPRLVTGSDGLMRFTDSAGNTQILYPAFLDPETLVNQVEQAVGGSTVIQTDGTALVTLWGGQKFLLTPDMTLGTVPPEQFAASWWQDGPNHYRVRTYSFSATSQGFSVTPR